MKRSVLNFIVDALMFLSILVTVSIGFLIKYTLIPGQERWVLYGKNVEIYLFGMDRHEWGTVHLLIGFIFLILLVLHIILHWNTIICVCKRIIHEKSSRKTIALVFIFISVSLLATPFLVSPKVEENIHGEERQRDNKTIAIRAKESRNSSNSLKEHKHSNLSIEVKGYMTLQETSNKYKVPTKFIKANLNIPISISNNSRMSRLRKKYNFEMSKVEEIINEFHEKNK